MRNLFEHEEKDYLKTEKVNKIHSDNYIIYESRVDKNKTVTIEEFLNKIRPYFKDIINDLKKTKYLTWKIQLMIAINFMSSENNDEEHVMHSRSDNIELMINDEEVIEEHFQSRLCRYEIGLETSVKGSDFIFACIVLICCNTNIIE